jgi:hypothetical protein
VTNSSLTRAFDCICEGESGTICVDALVGEGDRRMVIVNPAANAEAQLAEERGIKCEKVMCCTLFGHVSHGSCSRC